VAGRDLVEGRGAGARRWRGCDRYPGARRSPVYRLAQPAGLGAAARTRDKCGQDEHLSSDRRAVRLSRRTVRAIRRELSVPQRKAGETHLCFGYFGGLAPTRVMVAISSGGCACFWRVLLARSLVFVARRPLCPAHP